MTPPSDHDAGVARTTRQGKDTRDALSPSLQRVDELTAEGDSSLSQPSGTGPADHVEPVSGVLMDYDAHVLGGELYERFWERNPTPTPPPPFATQAEAIKRMWRGIGIDAARSFAAIQSRATTERNDLARDEYEARIAKLEAERDENTAPTNWRWQFPPMEIARAQLTALQSRNQDGPEDEWTSETVEGLKLCLDHIAIAAQTAEAQRDEALEIVALAEELVSPAGMVNRGVDRGLVVVERADKSDPHYRLCAALERRARALIRNENQIASREPSVGGK